MFKQTRNSRAADRRHRQRTLWTVLASGKITFAVHLHQSWMNRRLAGLTEPQQDVGVGDQRVRTLDADPLDQLVNFAQTGRVRQQYREYDQREREVDMVAGGGGK